jgi:hypothetical protein
MVTVGVLGFTFMYLVVDKPGDFTFFVFPLVALLLALFAPTTDALLGCLAVFALLGISIPVLGSFDSPGGAYLSWVVGSALAGAVANLVLRFTWRWWRRAPTMRCRRLAGRSRLSAHVRRGAGQ